MAVKKQQTKEVIKMNSDIATRLAEKARKAASKVNELSGVQGKQFSFVLIAQKGSKAIDPDEKDLYIDGLKRKQFYLMKEKKILGDTLRVVPLMFIPCYGEYSIDKRNPKKAPTFVGVWHKDDALEVPLAEGSYFDRPLPNGNVLRPINWVPVYLPDFPELEDIAVPFKSNSNKRASAWKKDAESRGSAVFENTYELTVDVQKSGDNSWFEIVPEFRSKVFEFKDDAIEIYEDFAEAVIERAEQIADQYEEGKVIPRRNVANILGYMRNVTSDHATGLLAAPAADDEDEDITF